MKTFIPANWYKLMIGASLLMASFGFMMYSITPANAKAFNTMPPNANYKMVPVNDDGTISVKLSDEQLDKIIPKNEDGSINIKLSEKQLNALSPNEIQSVNIAQINGYAAAAYTAYTRDGTDFVGLGVRETEPW